MELTKLERKSITLATFMILFASTSYFCKNTLSETTNICLMMIGMMPLLLFRRIRISTKVFVMVVVLCLISVFSSVLAGDEFKLILYPCLTFFVAIVYCSLVTLDEFKFAFSNIMVFTAGFAICAYLLYIFLPNLVMGMPTITNTSGRFAYNLLFAVITPRSFYRSEGFFWEPGAFQTFINIAIPMAFFSKNSQNKKRNLVVLYIALVLTFSTTAWIVGFFNLIYIIWGNDNYKNNKETKSLLGLVLLAIIGLILVEYLPSNFGGTTFGIEKIRSFLNGPSNGTFDSASVRYDSVYYPLLLFLDNPLFGAGYVGMRSLSENMLHNMLTCTPMNYFAMYGFVYGILIMWLLFSYCKTFHQKKIVGALIFLALLLTTFSEQYVNYAIVDVLIIFGASNLTVEKSRKTYEHNRD